MKIGVTGGTGFIGQYLLREYAGEHEFIVLTSGQTKKSLVQHEKITYIVSDYSEGSIAEAFAGCECLVHLGAKRSDKESEKAFENYEENIRFSERLFRTAKALGINDIVNISSTAVYDKELPCPFSEELAVSPLSYYGVCKLAIEMCAKLWHKRAGLHVRTLRVAQVIGAGERGGYMLSVFLDRCQKKEQLDVYGHGLAGKEYIYVKDVAYAIMCACLNKGCDGVYNIGTGVYTSNLELAKTFCRVFDNEAGYRLLTDKPEAVYDYRMDVTKAGKELGFSAKYNLEDAIADVKAEVEAQAGKNYG